MKIIFLDFDGVLFTYRALACRKDWKVRTWGEVNYDHNFCNLLERLCFYGKKYPVKIVVTSTWRRWEDDCFEVLEKIGVKQYLHENWKTGDAGHRGKEIKEWLDKYPMVSDYRIFDDETISILENHMSEKVVTFHKWDGINSEQAFELMEWIEPEPFPDPDVILGDGIYCGG